MKVPDFTGNDIIEVKGLLHGFSGVSSRGEETLRGPIARAARKRVPGRFSRGSIPLW
jgi:hypothetical protein